MLFITVLCLILNILSGVSALSLSRPRNTHKFSTQVGSSPIYSNKLFGIPSTQLLSQQRMLAAANTDNISLNNTRKQRVLVRLSKISQQLINLRKSIFKAATILSLVLFGFNKGLSIPPNAHAAWGSKSSNVVVVEAPPVVVKKASLVRTMTKLLVAAGALSVGLSVVPNTVGSSSSTINGEEDDRVVPKDEPSPLPLPTQNLELISKPKPTSKTLKPPKQSNTNTKKDQSLVKDLDSKIEMLRIREENAKASAEKERLADLERATEARKQEQAEIDARIQAEADKVVKEAQRQKAILAEKQREEELSKLESGKKFQQIKEQMSDDGGMVLEDVTSLIKNLPKKEISTTTPVVKMGSSGPAKSKEEDIELTTQVILEYVKSKENEEAGVVDDDQ